MLKRKIGLYLNYLVAKIKYRGRVKFNGFTVLYAFPKSKIDFIGKGITVESQPLSNLLGLCQRSIIIARYGGKIEIGEHCGISGSTIYAWESIKIGKYTRIGANCKIIDNDFHPIELAYRHKGLNKEYTRREPIEIGEDCFVGANSIILKGTKLGDNVIVGAGSVVHGTFPDNCVIAGNPAKVVKMLENEKK
jgi:acetyltransferase-like isoleucine patch superfamily enzyme